MLRYTYERRLNWSECDAGAIIFFPHYARWMVDGLNEMFLSMGVDPNGIRDSGARGGLPVLGLEMKFQSAPSLHDMVTHEINVLKVGSKSIRFGHRFFRKDELLMDAEETRVWAEHPAADPRALKTVAVPDEVRALLEQSV